MGVQMLLRTSLPALAVIAAFGATVAHAASTVATVTAVNEAAHTLTLSDDMVYTATPTMDLGRIKVGYTIRVSFATEGGANKVTSLEIISPAQPTGY
jgi:hypothetical protein